MIFTQLHHKMPIYKDCTFGELMTVALVTLLSLMLLLCLLAKCIFDELFIGYIAATILVLPVTRILLSILQRYKTSKPYGYYQHLLLKKIMTSNFSSLINGHHVIRLGRWRVERP